MLKLQMYHGHIIKKDLLDRLNIKNQRKLPKIFNIMVHTTLKHKLMQKLLMILALELLTGQQPSLIIAKKAIASFKLQKKEIISCRTDVRSTNMYNLMDTLIFNLLPDIEKHKIKIVINDATAHFGIETLTSFTEVQKRNSFFSTLGGLDVCIVTTATNSVATALLLSSFQLPITDLKKQ